MKYILKEAWTPAENDGDTYMIIANLTKSSPSIRHNSKYFVCLLIFTAILKLEDDYYPIA